MRKIRNEQSQPKFSGKQRTCSKTNTPGTCQRAVLRSRRSGRSNHTGRNFLCLVLLVLFASSCVQHKELIYFNEGEDFPNMPVPMSEIPVLTVQPDDILSIRVKTLDQEVAEPFNLISANMNLNNQSGGNSLAGYLVDKDGYIDFPVLGQILVMGLTTNEVRDKIVSLLVEGGHLVNPNVIVRFINFRVTILGEVGSAGTYTLNDERVTLLDALGQAGDVTPYGNRTNVLLIREYNGEREYVRLNLQDRDIFQSPYFYMKQNDVLYIEPLKEVTATVRDQSQRVLPWLSVISSLLALGLTITAL